MRQQENAPKPDGGEEDFLRAPHEPSDVLWCVTSVAIVPWEPNSLRIRDPERSCR
jgi:hypothetical protein